jgi:hypothetical protein
VTNETREPCSRLPLELQSWNGLISNPVFRHCSDHLVGITGKDVRYHVHYIIDVNVAGAIDGWPTFQVGFSGSPFSVSYRQLMQPWRLR